MKEQILIAETAAATARIAADFAARLRGGDVVVLAGELGAGKTAFVKGAAERLGIDPDRVLSPTFVLARTHQGREFKLRHYDLYRIGSVEEAYEAGLMEAIGAPDAVLMIEWADVLLPYLPAYYRVSVEVRADGARVIRIGKSQ